MHVLIIFLINKFSNFKQLINNYLKYRFYSFKDTVLCHFTRQELMSHVIPFFSIVNTNIGALLMFVIDFL